MCCLKMCIDKPDGNMFEARMYCVVSSPGVVQRAGPRDPLSISTDVVANLTCFNFLHHIVHIVMLIARAS